MLSLKNGREAHPATAPTISPERYVLLYDGNCRFCRVQAQNLLRLAKPGAVQALSFQEPGALEHFPGISHEACMRMMHLVHSDGRVFKGFEGAVRAVATRPFLGLLAYVYYLPGIRLTCDAIYARVAANRYRLMGKAGAAGECPEGTCSVHFAKR